ncbi:MAG: cellobiose phosphorylase [Candidatus Omnitrophota bacterium]
MSEKKELFSFLSDGITFCSSWAANLREIYMPLCGPKSESIKSSITPFLSGDIKINKSKYVTKPVSRQDLRDPVRNFFVRLPNGEIFSLTDRETAKSAYVEAGQLWHKVTNKSVKLGLEMTALNFVPVSGQIELMKVSVKNCGTSSIRITPMGCIRLFARSLANKHDHEHVTSLLHRTIQVPEGVVVSPTMAFNEEGHQEVFDLYFVLGSEADGTLPLGSFPTVDSFLGDSGTLERPQAVVEGWQPAELGGAEIHGKEAVGAVCFSEVDILPGELREYILSTGVASSMNEVQGVYRDFHSIGKFDAAFKSCERFWHDKSATIVIETGNRKFNSWMRWVALQPVLRRIFGCSFLPDHDYGKGGKGWRDLWQDLLSLIIIEPELIRPVLIKNFGGVRIDGSNATIIGSGENEFIADRNAITRVWMDHGAWPVLTVLLYIDQTGDADILFEKTAYFRDPQLSRTLKKDSEWRSDYGKQLKTCSGAVYQGTILEHMLVQTLTQFFNAGEHHMIRLESADWNDGMDMAFDRGESVAFTSFYTANLYALADLLEYLAVKKELKSATFFKEILVLLDSISGKCDYTNLGAKRRLLFENYFGAVEPEISGETVDVDIQLLVRDLRRKAGWLVEKIRSQEKISVEKDARKFSWFNGYYDNQGRKVEGDHRGNIRMTLTGQVFAVMGNVAEDSDVNEIVQSVKAFLKDEKYEGVHLNTDFGLRNYLDLGRAFSFAYGTKENGAIFSHMTVMYAFALYKRGFVREGFSVLDALYRMSADTKVSKIYPNVPEYFDSTGRGMYSYLTGSASWLILTLLTQVFGVRGEKGELVIEPKLVREQFFEGVASVSSLFAGKHIRINYYNPDRLDYGHYKINKILINGKEQVNEDPGRVVLKRSFVTESTDSMIIDIYLMKSAFM